MKYDVDIMVSTIQAYHDQAYCRMCHKLVS
jgi:hypothetical protein